MSVVRVLAGIAVCGSAMALAAPVPRDRRPVEPLAHFRFDGGTKNEVEGEPEFELKNTEFKGNALFLNGIYEHSGRAGGYRAVCGTPKLDYERFAVALRLKAEGFGEGTSNLVTGGTSYRWFGLERSPGGNLVVTLNNGDFRHEVEGAALEPEKWVVVACSVDVPGRKACVAVNGKKATAIDLPTDFGLAVVTSEPKGGDKTWSFANYGNGNVFHGAVDELLVYGRALSAEQLEKVPLRP